MLKFFDYIFWRWYGFFCKHKLFQGKEAEDAFGMLFILFISPIAVLFGTCVRYGIIPSFAMPLSKLRLLGIAVLLPIYLLCSYRYLLYPKIKKNNYEVFRTKWEKEPLPIRKRRKWLIIALFVLNCVIIPLILFMLP